MEMFNPRRVTEIAFGIKLQTFQKREVSHKGDPREDQGDKDSLLYCLNFCTGKYKISLPERTMTLCLAGIRKTNAQIYSICVLYLW